MKKGLSVLLLMAMTVTMLAGCSGDFDEASHNLSDIDVDKYVLDVGDYKGLQIGATKEEVTEEAVNEYIETMLENNPLKVEVTGRAAQTGDVVTIDFVGKKDGVAFDGGTASAQELELGSQTYIPGFEDGIVGMNVGDTKDLSLTFPENYGKKELAGQDVVFTVTLNKISEKQKAELNDEYVKTLGIDNCNDVESLKKEVKSALETYAESTYQSDLKQAAEDALVDQCKFADDVPEALLDYCKKELNTSFEQQLSQMGLTLDDYFKDYGNITQEQYDTQLTEGAKNAANLKMALNKIAKLEKITVTDEELDKEIEENYSTLGYASADDYKKNGSPEDYRDYLLMNKVKDFLISNAQITNAATTPVETEAGTAAE